MTGRSCNIRHEYGVTAPPADAVFKIPVSLPLNHTSPIRSDPMRSTPFLPKLHTIVLVALLPVLGGCDMLADLLELPNPARQAAAKEAEGRAIGGACRHAGRSLEDCYTLNGSADKAAVFAGWRDMNDYMMEHKLDIVPSKLVPGEGKPAPTQADGAAINETPRPATR